MNRQQIKTLETARRVQAFLDEQSGTAGRAVPRPLRAKLNATVGQLAAHQIEQEIVRTLAKLEAARRRTFRRDLQERLITPIGRIAAFALNAELEVGLMVLQSTAHRQRDFVSQVMLLTEAAEQYKDVFVRHGMRADFVKQLRAALGQIGAANEAAARLKKRQVAATAEIRTDAKSTRSIVGFIDAMLTPALRNDQALSADWAATKRVAQPSATPDPAE